MSSAKDIASGFTISGLLDQSAKTQRQYPVVEIPVADIEDHPENVTYSMDERGIETLAKSIREQGLTDLPLVRKRGDGSYQMLSGHRRKAAYSLLAETDDSFAKIPCRVMDGIDDSSSVLLLHAANYFTRSLSITERAAATRALGIEVDRRRAHDSTLTGVRTEDIKASILQEQTGRKVSGKTIKRQEALADLIETRLIEPWQAKAESGSLSASCIETLAGLSEAEQINLYDALPEAEMSKSALSDFVSKAVAKRKETSENERLANELELAMRATPHPNTDARLLRALANLRNYLAEPPKGSPDDDFEASSLIRRLSGFLPNSGTETPKGAVRRLRRD